MRDTLNILSFFGAIATGVCFVVGIAGQHYFTPNIEIPLMTGSMIGFFICCVVGLTTR